ncbi:MAG: 50S ribosomal protein L18 [Vampirovibrionales bacterium]|jgi:large subunit ribosomal protein L18|nr:50S ribosomal protein L18 [Vampirovibrionales bacterium]
MFKQINRKQISRKRHLRVRKKVSGTAEFPRLAVHRSGKHIYVQAIDDVAGVTLAAASSLDKELKAVKSGANIEAAKVVGDLVAKRLLAKGVESVVFDRGGFLYHGRVAALADAAREAGLQF